MMIELLMGRLRIDGKRVFFTRHETTILWMLFKNKNVTLAEFEDALWNGEHKPKTLGVQMFNIRKKIRPFGLKIVFEPSKRVYYLTEKARVSLCDAAGSAFKRRWNKS